MSTILIIDDSRDNAEMMGMMVSRMGHEPIVETYSHGARKIVLEHRIDMFVVDLIMPDFSGIEVVKSLRGDERYADTPMLGVTASVHPSIRETAYAAGFDEILLKPFLMREFTDLVTRLLRAREPY